MWLRGCQTDGLDYPVAQFRRGIALIDRKRQQRDGDAQRLDSLAMLGAALEVILDVKRFRDSQGIQGVAAEEFIGLLAAQLCGATTNRSTPFTILVRSAPPLISL
jgi:hypothetical protein